MEMTIQNIGTVTVFTLDKKLDSLSAPGVEKALLPAIQNNAKYVMNMAELVHISSAGLRVLLMAAKKVRSANSRMILCDVPEPIREIFDIAGFTSIFEIAGTQAEAVETLQA